MVAPSIEVIKKLKFELSPSQHTVHISPHLITIFLDHSKVCYVDADLQMMNTLRLWCICGFAYNKNFLHRWCQEVHGLK